MEWGSWAAFWDMGGYGFFVWGSYLVTALCILGEVLWLRHSGRTTRRRLKRMLQWESQ